MKRSRLLAGVGIGLTALVGSFAFITRAATDARADTPGKRADAPAKTGKTALTFTRDIAPILYNNCASCHRPGEVSPFSLLTYQDVKSHAPTIAAVTQSRYMPPWKASPHFGGPFVGERRLTDAQIVSIQQWMKDGAPQGDPADLPALPKFPEGWKLGKPDAIVQPDQPYPLAADGRDVYRCFVIPTDYKEDRFLSAVEVHPGAGKVVHHVIAYLDTTGKARELDAKDPGPGYTSFGGPGFVPSGALGGWVPGNDPVPLPDGVGIALPKGADIVLQVHYHKDGKPETDLTKVGLYFAKALVDKRVRALPIINPFLYLAPGETNHAVTASVTLPDNVTALDVLPHMHLLGHDMTVTATLPNGTVKPMVKVNDYDFSWQTRYTYQQPLPLPRGTKLSMVAHYDNSTNNPRNPNNPPKKVTWGEETTDEMCIAFVSYTLDAEHLTKGIAINDLPELGQAIGAGLAGELITQFDKDKDGKLNADELAEMIGVMRQGFGRTSASPLMNGDPKTLAKQAILLLDRNGDGALDAGELSRVVGMMRGMSGGRGKRAGNF